MIVFGFSKAETDAWQAPATIISLTAGVVLLVAFVLTERRVDQPLLPLHIVWDRARGGAFASIAIAGASVFGVFLFLTYFMQQNLGYSPLKTGVAFLPMTLMIFVIAPTVQTKVLPRVGVRPIVMTGMALGALAMLLFFSQLTPSSTYAGHVLPGLVMIGVGMPCIFAPCFATATLGVDRYDAGVASAMVNTCQQVGGAVGTAVLSTIFATAAASYASSHVQDPGLAASAAVHGYTTAFSFAAILFGVGLLTAAFVLPVASLPSDTRRSSPTPRWPEHDSDLARPELETLRAEAHGAIGQARARPARKARRDVAADALRARRRGTLVRRAARCEGRGGARRGARFTAGADISAIGPAGDTESVPARGDGPRTPDGRGDRRHAGDDDRGDPWPLRRGRRRRSRLRSAPGGGGHPLLDPGGRPGSPAHVERDPSAPSASSGRR